MVEYHVYVFICIYLFNIETPIIDVHSILVLLGIDKSIETTKYTLLSHPTTAVLKNIHKWRHGFISSPLDHVFLCVSLSQPDASALVATEYDRPGGVHVDKP